MKQYFTAPSFLYITQYSIGLNQECYVFTLDQDMGNQLLAVANERCIIIKKDGTSPLTLSIGAFLLPELEASTSRCFMDPKSFILHS